MIKSIDFRRTDMKTNAAKKSEPAVEPVKQQRKLKYDRSYTINVLRTDMQPKRNKRNPYALYKSGATIGELLDAGVLLADFWWDSEHTKAIEIVRK